MLAFELVTAMPAPAPPPAPDPAQSPALAALWQAAFGPGMARVAQEAPAQGPRTRLFHRSRGVMLVGGSRLTLSGNWSGGWIGANRGERFRTVAARWRVPAVKPGHAADANGSPYRCSIWVGIDGKRRWAASMPQLGSEHSADGTHRLWWQWWVRNSTDLQNYVPLAIDTGDEIIGYLHMVTPSEAIFGFANLTTRQVAIATRSNPDHPMRGTSAEWVLERPADGRVENGELIEGQLFPMPDFGRVVTEGFAARTVRLDDPSQGRERDLRPCRMIRNGTLRTAPMRVVVTARARRSGRAELAAEYAG